jgi:nucleotide-binding universal stress UspA family protein
MVLASAATYDRDWKNRRMPLSGPILIATDFSAGAAEALRQAHQLAGELRAPLVVGHVIPEAYRVRVLFPHAAGVDAETQRELQAKAADAAHEQIRAVLGPAAGPLELRFESGSPHAGILKLAEQNGAALIVMGPGATTARVARAGHHTVLVARPSPSGGAVLGASDFSDPSLPALRLAAAEAARRHARLRLIHCLDIDASAYLAAAGAPGVLVTPPFPDEAVKEMEADARDRLRTIGGDAELVVVRYSPLSAITSEATETPTSLVVVGTHGRSGLARLALGSVAETVMRDAPCSVLVVPLQDH